jgi:hypothetical protein
MNDFSDLEAELKQLRPAGVSPELMTRVERALNEAPSATPTAGVLPSRKPTVGWFALGFGLAAAAAFLLLARANVDRATAPQPARVASASPPAAHAEVPEPRQLVPDGLTRVVYNTRDEGLVFPADDDQPVRRVRSISRETLAFKDPSSGASLRVSYPTEDIRYIPVSGQ